MPSHRWLSAYIKAGTQHMRVVRVQAGLVSDISGDDWFREFSTTYVRSTSSSMKHLQYGNSKSVDIYGFMHTLHYELGAMTLRLDRNS